MEARRGKQPWFSIASGCRLCFLQFLEYCTKREYTICVLNIYCESPLLKIVYIRRRAVNPRLNRKLDIILEIQYHGIVAVGMVLTIVAVVHILNGGEISKNRPLLDAGSAITCLAWVLVVLWAVWSHFMNRRFSSYSDMQTSENGKMVSSYKHTILFLLLF